MKNVIKVKIKGVLKERKMTQKELSIKTGIREGTIGEIVRGKKKILKFEHLSKIADVLEVDDISQLIEIEVLE